MVSVGGGGARACENVKSVFDLGQEHPCVRLSTADIADHHLQSLTRCVFSLFWILFARLEIKRLQSDGASKFVQ